MWMKEIAQVLSKEFKPQGIQQLHVLKLSGSCEIRVLVSSYMHDIHKLIDC